MSDARFTIDLEGNVFKVMQELRKDTQKLKTSVTGIETKSKKAFDSMSGHIKNISFVNVTQGLENVTQSLADLAGPGMHFESAMADLSAITGQTGDQLDHLGEMARKNAKIFGGDAASSVNTFKLLLSQLGPQLADTPEVLNMMAQNAEKLAKTMNGDVKGATEVITTAMNQYNVDTTNAAEANAVMTDMMNSMAASAKEGSSELPTLQAAVKNVGGDAMRANVSFEEMLSSIQLLDKAGKKGAEGGIALRNVIATMNQGRFLPKDVQEELISAGVSIEALSDKSLSFTDRLRQLEAVSGDAALMSKLFGRENAAGAQALVQSIDKQEQMTTAISGTNTAMEQAETIMATSEEKQKRLQASIDDFKVSLFNATGGVFAYLEPISDVARQLSAFVPIVSAASSGVKMFRKSKLAGAIATKAVAAAQWLWNAALTANPIGLVIAGVAALAAGAYFLTKALKGTTTAQAAANAVNEKAIDIAGDEMAELTLLTETIKSAKEGTDERKKAISELNDKYPDILSKYKEEELTNEKINELHKDISKNIMKRARSEAAAELYKEKIKERMKEANEGPGFLDQVIGLSTPGFSAEQFQAMDVAKLAQEEQALLGQVVKNKKDQALEDGKSKKTKTSVDTDTSGNDVADTKTPLVPTRDKVIQGSGGEMKNINVRIENLVKNITISTQNMKESTGQIKKQVTQAMVAAVRDFEVAM